jgi:hypothetical protein
VGVAVGVAVGVLVGVVVGVLVGVIVGVALGVLVGVIVGVLVGVLVGVWVGVVVGVGVGVGNQFTLAPESTELVGAITVAAMLVLSCTSTYEIAREPCGLIDQVEPPALERRESSCPDAPWSVRVPVVVWVVPAVKYSISADETLFVKL